MGNRINLCHISDLHFGIFENKSFSNTDSTCSLPYSLIGFISQLDESEKPHFLIISGDLTSISEKDEYKQFFQFIEAFIKERCFARCKFNKYTQKDRIIIVPGNHDVVRKLRSGKEFGSDELKSFKENIVKKGFNTPLGKRRKYCYTEKEKHTGQKRHPCPIPCSIYYYPEYNILFATLVSCYFAHKIKPEILNFGKQIKKLHKEILELREKIGETDIDEGIIRELEEKIKELIYFDYGSFRQNYMRVINRAFNNFKAKKKFTNEKYNNLLKFAVTHHHLKDMPFPQINTQNAKQTRELLGKHGVIAVLHGHLHEVLEEYQLPYKWKDISSFFSCGTVSAYCANTVNMFNIIEIQNYKEIKNMAIKILCYKVDAQGYFTKKKVHSLYSGKIKKKFLKSMNNSF